MKHFFTIAFLMCVVWQSYAQDTIPCFVPGKVFVETNAGYPMAICEYDSAINQSLITFVDGFPDIAQEAGVYKIEKTFKILGPKNDKLRNCYTIRFSNGYPADSLVLFLNNSDMIKVAEKVPLGSFYTSPSDFSYTSQIQWGLFKINAEDAWDYSTGKKKVRVAVVDDAVLIDHEDLKNKIWVNQGEIPDTVTDTNLDGIIDAEELLASLGLAYLTQALYGYGVGYSNSVDDDNNGYVDDILGWDASTITGDNNPSPMLPTIFNPFTHGTGMSGIIAAETSTSANSPGIASIGWDISIIPVKFRHDTLTGDNFDMSDAIRALEYAIAVKPDVINLSWGSLTDYSKLEILTDVAFAKGIIIVAAAGNNGGLSTETLPNYPAAYEQVLSVGATNSDDEKWEYSSSSSDTLKWIDVMAPGDSIYSTLNGNTFSEYGYKDGTSCAAPLVAGLAGLMKSYCPTCSPSQIIKCIKDNCDPMPTELLYDTDTLDSRVGHGRINAFNSIKCLTTLPPNAAFAPSLEYICPGSTVQFMDESTGFITQWNWTTTDPYITIVSASDQNPYIIFPNIDGYIYTLTLTVTNDSITTNNTSTFTLIDTLHLPTATIAFPDSVKEICNGSMAYFLVSFENANPPYTLYYSNNASYSMMAENLTQNPSVVYVNLPQNTASYFVLDSIQGNDACVSDELQDTSFFVTTDCDCEPKFNNHWHYGYHNGLQFEATANSPITQGNNEYFVPNFFGNEGVASISDAHGDFMFSTDGVNIYDKSFNVMTNGSGIQASSSSSQGDIILPKNPLENTYYLITVKGVTDATPFGIWYHVIDMDEPGNGTSNDPCGEVVSKNNVLDDDGMNVSEHITWTKHGSEKNTYWVFTTQNQGFNFFVYKVNKDSIYLHSVNFINSNNFTLPRSIGCLKASQTGDRLAATYSYPNPTASNYVELYNFNNLTGQISYLDVVYNALPFCVEFSPDGDFLYVTNRVSPSPLSGVIARYKIQNSYPYLPAPNNLNIPMSNIYTGIQLAPDKEQILYYNSSVNTVGIITNPDQLFASDLIILQDYYYLDTATALPGQGLPQLVPTEILTVYLVDIENECEGNANGSATVGVEGGCPPFTVEWSDSLQQTTAQATGLSAGTYTVYVEDACGCSDLLEVTIENTSININADVHNSCFNLANGYIDITVTGGVLPYNYIWSTGETTEDMFNLAEGSYSLTVSDSHGCSSSMETYVFYSPPMDVNIISKDPCGKTWDGYIMANVSGGTSPYTYWWSNFSTNDSIGGLSFGTSYCVTVTDAFGCADTICDSLSFHPDPLAIAAISPVSCYGYSDGAIDITASQYPPFTYLWSNGSTTEDIENLAAGLYTVEIWDSIGCYEDTTFEVFQPDPLEYGLITSSVKCDCTGYASINDYTSAGYQVVWSTGGTTYQIDNLCPDTYYVTITDSVTTCSMVDTVIIEYDTTLLWANFVPTFPSCSNVNNGELMISVEGQYPIYYVEWSPFGVTDTVVCAPIGNSYQGTSPVYSNLPQGFYSITVTNDVGCIYTDSIYLEPEYELDFSVYINSYCSVSSPADASINIVAGVPPLSYNWSTGDTTAIVQDLSPGAYGVTITDINGCFGDSSFTISADTPYIASMVVDSFVCISYCTGTANVELHNFASGPFTIEYGTTSFQSNDTIFDIDSLCAGIYIVTVTDSSGCSVLSEPIIIQEFEPIFADFQVTSLDCYEGSSNSVDLTLTADFPPYSYNWSTGATTQDIIVNISGNYYVTISDNKGCQLVDTLEVFEFQKDSVSITPLHPTCEDPGTGSLVAVAQSGISPFSYQWSTGATTDTLLGCVPGSIYAVTMIDAYGCYTDTIGYITDIYYMTIEANTTPPICGDTINGFIDIEVYGGASPFSYNWTQNSSFYSNNQDIGNLKTDSIYSLTVTDNEGCVITFSDTMPPSKLDIYLTILGQGCNGTPDSSHVLNSVVYVDSVKGGNPPYHYQWSTDTSTTNNFIYGNTDGTVFSLTVTDDNGTCTGIVNDTLWSDQHFTFPAGWSIFSTYLYPANNLHFKEYFEEQNVDVDIHIVKDGDGHPYWPAYNLSQIQYFTVGEGYQIRMYNQRDFELKGSLVCPEDESLYLTQGWSILGYLRTTPDSIVDMMSTIVVPNCSPCNVIIMKDEDGNVYWPLWGFDGIKMMYPGKGYQINMGASVYFSYPANENIYGTKSVFANEGPVFKNFSGGLYVNTDNFMVIGIPYESWDTPPVYGDEIAAFGEHGQLVGRSLYTGGFTAIVVYGDDHYTPDLLENLDNGESFYISVWNPETKASHQFHIKTWQQGDGLFLNKKISIAGIPENVVQDTSSNAAFRLEVYPNPGKGQFRLRIFAPERTNAIISIFNNQGQCLLHLPEMKLQEGWQEREMDLTDLSNGLYHLSLNTGPEITNCQVVIIK